jgi:hypothetical protein
MGPIRELLSRIRERRMERMGSRQGMFPRLRNLINPLDSQSMMDRAQGTKVGTASPAPLSYSKRLFPSTAGGPATAAPKVAGKPAPSNPAQEDLDAIPQPGLGDLPSQYQYNLARARRAQALAEVQGQPDDRRAEYIAEAERYMGLAQRTSSLFTQKNTLEELGKQKPALTGQFESQQDVERRLLSGEITPAAGATVVFNAKQAGRGDGALVGPAAAQELQDMTRQFTMPYVAGQMRLGQMPTPGSPLGEQFRLALDTLPPEQRQPFVTASLGPALASGYIRSVQAAAPSGIDLTNNPALNRNAQAYAQATLAKIDPSFYGEAQGGGMLKFLGDAATGAGRVAGQVLPQAQAVGRGGERLLQQVMGRPDAAAAPPASIPPLLPAAPVAPPVAQPLQMAPSRPPAPPVAPPPRVAPTREEIIRKAKEEASPTYPNGQLKPWAIPQGRK